MTFFQVVDRYKEIIDSHRDGQTGKYNRVISSLLTFKFESYLLFVHILLQKENLNHNTF